MIARTIKQVVAYDPANDFYIVLDDQGELWQYVWLPGRYRAWQHKPFPPLPPLLHAGEVAP